MHELAAKKHTNLSALTTQYYLQMLEEEDARLKAQEDAEQI